MISFGGLLDEGVHTADPDGSISPNPVYLPAYIAPTPHSSAGHLHRRRCLPPSANTLSTRSMMEAASAWGLLTLLPVKCLIRQAARGPARVTGWNV